MGIAVTGYLKNDGEIRICVEVRLTNEMIIRKQHTIPTEKEFWHWLNGSTMLSELDLRYVSLDCVGQRQLPDYNFYRSLKFVSQLVIDV